MRQIASGIGQDYRITYVMTMRLARQKCIIAERRRPVTYCRLNFKGNSTLLAYIEGIRASRFLAKHRDIEVLIDSITEKTASPFFTMIVFGSMSRALRRRGRTWMCFLLSRTRRWRVALHPQ